MERQKDNQKDILPSYLSANDFYDHARKIITAIYLLTDILKDEEPIKWTLRTNIIEVMSDTGVLSRSFGARQTDGDEKDIIEKITSIQSLLDAGVFAGLVSPSNHEILSKELAVFQRNAVRHFHEVEGNQSLITSALFSSFSWDDVPQIPESLKGHSDTYKGHIKDTQTNIKHVATKRTSVASKKTTKAKNATENNGATQSDRKSKILSIIRTKGNVMIKDITPDFPGVSEKTIQRDLLDLVAKGSISKTGERRWTTYSII